MSAWSHHYEDAARHRFLHCRVRPEFDVESTMSMMSSSAIGDTELFSFPADAYWFDGEHWLDGVLLRFTSDASPRALATEMAPALERCSAWGIHDGRGAFSESDGAGPLAAHYGKRPGATGIVAVMFRDGSSPARPIEKACEILRCGAPFLFSDGALFFTASRQGLGELTAPLRNRFAHVGGWDGYFSFYGDAPGGRLWDPIDLAELAFREAEDPEPEEP